MKTFDSVPIKVPAKNVFSLDHDVKATYNFGKLYPFLCHPVYPGDTFNCRAEVFMRCLPLLAPLMHNVDMRLYFFFVPMRLVWNENKKSDWKTFITGGEDGMQNPELPFFTYKQAHEKGAFLNVGSLADHLGFPTQEVFVTLDDDVASTKVCSLPFRGYQLIWNEYFRNQNIQNEIEFSYGEGQETDADLREITTIRYKNWEKDYFTSCLPFAQRGQAVRLPIDFDASGASDVNISVSGNVALNQALKAGTQNYSDITSHSSGGDLQFLNVDNDVFSNDDIVNLTGSVTATGVINAGDIAFTGLSIGTINDFRYCLRLQQWLENNARCGSRYIEQLLAHFGVTSSDARLQRPELLGGGVIPLLFTDVEQTSFGEGSSNDVLGDLAGKGTLYGKTDGFKKYFEEHGIIFGLLSIVPRTSYSQGIPRYWTAFDKTDWYFPEFANLGEQAVLNKEVYFNPVKKAQGEPADEPDGVFGYQGRFSELRYIPSRVCGEMKTDLQYWHLGRIFPSEPALNNDFIECYPRVNIFALEDIVASDYDPFICQIHLDISAVRPLPKYAVPTL